MAWVKFTMNFDWRVARTGRTIAYQQGTVMNVTSACAARAIAARRAVPMVKTHRHAEPQEVSNVR